MGYMWTVNRLEMTVLGPMLCQIVVSLLPLLQLLPSQVAAIFQYLIVENRWEFNEYSGCHAHRWVNGSRTKW